MEIGAVSVQPFMMDSRSTVDLVGEDVHQVMVYGCDHAKYVEVQDALDRTLSCIDRVFDMQISSTNLIERTLEGRVIEVVGLNNGMKDTIGRSCKTAITSLLLENYKRIREGQYLIPLIFCLESEDTPVGWKLNPIMLTTKFEQSPDGRLYNSLISCKELRRMYKHCTEFAASDHIEFQMLARVAQATFRFVRIEQVRDTYHRFVQIPAVWEDGRWKREWDKRIQDHFESRYNANQQKKYHWREDLLLRLKWYDRQPTVPFPAEWERIDRCQSRSRMNTLPQAQETDS